MRYNLLICLLIFSLFLITGEVKAKYITKPPSIALRNEVSFVCEVRLESVLPKKDGQAVLNFTLIKDLHNKSQKYIKVNSSSKLASQLLKNQSYIIAYTNVKQVKVEGIKRYIPLKNGSVLLSVQGAEPAIFNYHESLEKQLTSSPKLTRSNRKVLMDTIFNGMAATDPKIKEFFVREIVNWKELNKNLTNKQTNKLRSAFISANNSVGIMIAVMENRPELHKKLGIKFLGKKALSLLQEVPVKLDVTSQVPNLILNALYFSKAHSVATFNVYQRWSRCNVPSIVENSLLAMKSINSSQMLKFVHENKNNTLLSPSTRRVFGRLDKSEG